MKKTQIALLAAATILNSAIAQSTWLTPTSGNWNDSTNWSAGVPNAQGAIAVLSNNWTGQTITNAGTNTIGQLQAFDTSTNTGLNIIAGTLLLDNGASKPIINTGLNTAFGENPGNRLRIGSVLDGTNGFERQGGGYVDISGVTNTFSGTIVLTAPASGGGSFLVINSDSNLGAATNTITATLSAQALGLYNEASAGNFTLNANRTISTSGTGDFWVKNKAGANMTIAGAISGTARLRKNDSGDLTLTAANTFTGGTLIDGSGRLVLSGGNNRLLSTSFVQFATNGILDVTSTSQTLSNLVTGTTFTTTVRGTNGALTINGNLNYNIHFLSSVATNASVLNMGGLSSFTLSAIGGPASRTTEWRAGGVNVTNTIVLANGTNTIASGNLYWGGGFSNVVGQRTIIRLGQVNNINVDTNYHIGNFQGSGEVNFQAGLTNPTLTLRGAGGGDAFLPFLAIGNANSGNQGTTGILDATGGTIDAKVTDFVIGNHNAGSSVTAAIGIINLPAGTVNATTLALARKTATGGAPTVNGTMNQSGGSVTVDTVYLGQNLNTAEAPNLVANYNLTGGTLYATTIGGNGTNYGASTVRNLNVNGGTVANKAGANLGIDGLTNTTTGRLNVVLGALGGTFEAESGRAINIGANTLVSGSGGLTKTGEGTLSLSGTHTYNGPTLISDGTLRLELSSSIASAVTVGATGAIGGAGTIANTLAFDSGAKFVFSLTETLLVDGASVTFSSFGIDDLIGLDNTVENGTYTIIGGLADIDTTGLLNLGEGNAFDLGGGKSAYFTEGSLVVNVVPEPGTYALLALAAAGFGAHVLRRRSRK